MKKVVLILLVFLFAFSNEKTYKMQFTETEVEQIKQILAYTVNAVDNSKMEHDQVKNIVQGMDFVYKKLDNQVKAIDSLRKK